MLDQIKSLIMNNKIVQFGLVLIAGIAIGAIFYPTSIIEDKLKQKHEEEITVLKEQHQKELLSEQEKVTQITQQMSSYKQETEKKITSLTTEITTLKSHQKTAYFKIIRPDGTIEIRKFSESETEAASKVTTEIQEEFKTKIESIEQKWSAIHKERVTQIKKEFDAKEQEYKKTIDELEKSHTVITNPKKLSIEAGMTTDRNYYGHATYDVFGPIFIGVHTEFGQESSIGGGIGIKF